MNIAKEWKDYEIIDMANGEKLERWKNIKLVRPDPQIIWKDKSFPKEWDKANAIYRRSNKGGGGWSYKSKLPESWQVKYKELTFNIKPMGFKHTGLFPEQAVNWDWMISKIRKATSSNVQIASQSHESRKLNLVASEKSGDFSYAIKNAKRPIKVLNLFAYTGGASVACLYAGASVCHVDSSKGMVSWAKENVTSSGLQDRPIRYIVDDVVKFVNREIRRGNKYDAIIMDPPSYGRGASGEVWQFENNISDLISLCTNVLSDNPLFFLINSYTTGISSEVLGNLLKLNLRKYKGTISAGEIGLPMSNSELVLPCGIYGRWESK